MDHSHSPLHNSLPESTHNINYMTGRFERLLPFHRWNQLQKPSKIYQKGTSCYYRPCCCCYHYYSHRYCCYHYCGCCCLCYYHHYHYHHHHHRHRHRHRCRQNYSSFGRMCKLTAHNYTLCNHKLWRIKQGCSQATEDQTLPYPGCRSFPTTACTLWEPPSEAVVETRYYHTETCQLLGCKYSVRPEMVISGWWLGAVSRNWRWGGEFGGFRAEFLGSEVVGGRGGLEGWNMSGV